VEEFQFKRSIELYDCISSAKLGDCGSVREAFRLSGDISYWDCLSTYLVLYRFPTCFLDKKKVVTYKEKIRPFLGALAHKYESLHWFIARKNKNSNERSKTNIEKSILFLGFNEIHYRDVLKSVYVAVNNENFFCTAQVLESSRKKYSNQKHLNISDFISKESLSRISKDIFELKKIKKELLNIMRPGMLKDPVDCLVDWPALRREISWICNREIPRLIYYAAMINEIFFKNNPLLIITADDADQRSKVVEFYARKQGISTLVIQQGYASQGYPDWHYFTGDYVAAMSEKSLQAIEGQGVERKSITVTGHPGFDRLKTIYVDETLKIRQSLNIQACKFIALFASQPYVLGAFISQEARLGAIKDICESISSIEGVQLIVKAHPFDDIGELRRICKSYKNAIIIGRELEVCELIKSCDVFITMFSTTTLEALYADKPVINIDFTRTVVNSAFLAGKATRVVKNKLELIDVICKLIAGNNNFFTTPNFQIEKSKLLNDWVYKNDGLATVRVVKLIKYILKSEGKIFH